MFQTSNQVLYLPGSQFRAAIAQWRLARQSGFGSTEPLHGRSGIPFKKRDGFLKDESDTDQAIRFFRRQFAGDFAAGQRSFRNAEHVAKFEDGLAGELRQDFKR